MNPSVFHPAAPDTGPGAAAPSSLDPFRHVTFLGEGVDGRIAGGRPAAAGAVGVKAIPELEPAPGIDADSAAFFAALCADAGLRHARYRESIFIRRRAACLRALRVDTPSRALQLIDADARAGGRALAAVMIGVTAFFRDPAVFEELSALLRPLAEARGGAVDVLSLGCSDGSELYSVAMLMEAEGLLARARLWGVDCRAGAIDAARAGEYPAVAAQGVPGELRRRCFSPVKRRSASRGGGADCAVVGVSPDLRGACRWIVADAFGLPSPPEPHAPAPQVDLLLCRNLAIYLNAAAAAELWAMAASRVRAGGVLVVGKAERPCGGAFTRIAPCIYRKRGATP